MSAALRRLAKEHMALREDLPPNYLFPDEDSALPDDLFQLEVLLTGTTGTPFSNGLWRLSLKVPADYPQSPPKAFFKVKIFHPNVEESTGAVCLETLKAGWKPTLSLRDILVHISCLLIQPNPDSALNAAAGALIQEDYNSFCKQAQLMTSIHAPIPKSLAAAVLRAKQRGEEKNGDESEDVVPLKGARDASTEANHPTPPVAVRGVQKSTLGKRAFGETPTTHANTRTSPDEKNNVTHEPQRKCSKTRHDTAVTHTSNVVSRPDDNSEHEHGRTHAIEKPTARSSTDSSTRTHRKTSRGAPRLGIRRL